MADGLLFLLKTVEIFQSGFLEPSDFFNKLRLSILQLGLQMMKIILKLSPVRLARSSVIKITRKRKGIKNRVKKCRKTRKR